MGKIQTVSKYMKWEISGFFLEVTTYISLPQVWFQPLGLRDEVPGLFVWLVLFILYLLVTKVQLFLHSLCKVVSTYVRVCVCVSAYIHSF